MKKKLMLLVGVSFGTAPLKFVESNMKMSNSLFMRQEERLLFRGHCKMACA